MLREIEILGVEINGHNPYFRQKPEENNEFNEFFTECHIYWPRQQLEEVKLLSKNRHLNKPAVVHVSQSAKILLRFPEQLRQQ